MIRHLTARAAFQALYDEHRDAVWRYAARRVADLDAADDVTTEVFVVAWRRREVVPADALPWLYGVARKVVANHRRAADRRRSLQERLEQAAAPAVTAADDPVEAMGGREAVVAALERLTESDRELLMLVAWEGLDADRLAAALGCRRGTAAVRLHRARKRLRAALDLDPDPSSTLHAPCMTPEKVTR
jgi:RNA polymerase sigma-70 factor (ECF subfamily)